MKVKEFYKTRAWYYFSKYILMKYARKSGKSLLVQCSTSGRWYELNDPRIQAGHFIKVFDGNSTNFATAFDERNVLPQSSADNRYFSGKPDVMMVKIDEIHGEGTTLELRVKSKNFMKLDKFTLDLIKDEFKVKFDSLVIERGVNPWKK